MKRLSLIMACTLVGTAGIAASGCQQGKSSKDEGKAKESASEKTGEEGEGPCAQYTSQVCEKAGKSSSSCKSLTSATELMPPAACEAALANVDFTLAKLDEKRATCDELQKKLCDELGEDSESCKMVKEQTPNFPPERCETMMAQYDKVLADLKRREEMNKPLPDEKAEKIASGDVPAFGPEDAAVTIVEFSDFQCPYCSRAAKVAEKVKEEYGEKVRFVFRQYPLPMHSQAKPAAKAALAAHEQGKFWEYHDKLFENQKQLSDEDLVKYAEEVGLDVAKFKKALEDEAHAEQIEKDMALGKEVNVRGTPTMFLNGERVSNPTSFQVVEKMIKEELEES